MTEQWWERAEAAERIGDWEAAIVLVAARAECYSADSGAHGDHLWHMDLLARAGRLPDLTERALTDVHARRRLNRSLRERGMEGALRKRAEDGDRDALYVLIRWLCETSRVREARLVVHDLGAEDRYAHEIVAGFRPPHEASPPGSG